ncbi:MAG: YfcE family phosphodiesterase [Planctomycetes bacterium]|nr:YfcE family phosphodiesterase [Planctomycetota bacterium]
MLKTIGLLSDSHGQAETTLRAVKLLVKNGAQLLIHLGDLESMEVLTALAVDLDGQGRLSPPVHLVFGNVDADKDLLSDFARTLGIAVNDPVGRLEVAGKTLVFQHGDSKAWMKKALSEGVDYLCHGHTHVPRDERIGRTRVINPGALFRAQKHTVAILEVPEDRLQLLAVPEE